MYENRQSFSNVRYPFSAENLDTFKIKDFVYLIRRINNNNKQFRVAESQIHI